MLVASGDDDDDYTYNENQRKARYSRDKQAEIAEVGPPPISDEQRREGDRLRELCKNDLERFHVEVFPNSTGLKPFGLVQKQSIAHDEAVIIGGGRVCRAEPRGFGKTSRTCGAALWAVAYGYRRMIPVFSANIDKSKTQIMSRWKSEILSNDILLWMFPDLIWPLRALENKPQRCASQTYMGKQTRTSWTADRIVLPHVPGVAGSGGCLIALPLKSCRGATHTVPDGTILRPDLCILDDVQKDEDADNPNTVRKLEDLIDHTALMLGSHAETMSAIMNCTVRQPDDLSETYLKKTSWGRVRYKMLVHPAKREKDLWLGKYAEIRTNYDPENADDRQRAVMESLAFYKEHREEMDEGGEVSWDWAYAWADKEPTEISALQHAYNIKIDLGDSVFNSECQNEPARDCGSLVILTPEQIRNKQSGWKRDEFPNACTVLTCKIDVHPSILYWQVWAWEPNFTGYCINYGTFPDQKRRHFRHDSVPIPLENVFPGYDDDARVTAGLDALIHGSVQHRIQGLCMKQWTRADSVPMKLRAVDIDANGQPAKAIKSFVKSSPFAGIVYPSFGKSITALQPPMNTWKQHKGVNCEWVYNTGTRGEPTGILVDVNYWKTKFHQALALPAGSQGALYLFNDEPMNHRLVSEHWYAEAPKEQVGGLRTIYSWSVRPMHDNHYLDVAVGAMVGASTLGISSVVKTKTNVTRPTAAQLYAR